MTVTASIKYGTSTALTMTLASLASDTNLLAGRVATALDNTSTLAVDYSLYFKVTTGTSPTASRQIEVWAAPSEDGTNYAGGAGATDANKTFVAETKADLVLLGIQPTNSTSNTAYELIVPSLASAFGGVMPRKCNFFVVHNTGVALNATGGNHAVTATAIQYTSV